MSYPFFRFQRMGLRRNPFGRLSDAEWRDIAVIPDAVETAVQTGDTLLLVGDKGRGKSTLLRGLVARLQEQSGQVAYEHLSIGVHHYETDLTSVDVFALDEAQRLYPWAWLPLIRHARRGMQLLIGTHRDDAWWLRRVGLPVTVFAVADLTTRAHIAAVHRQRIAYFTLPDAEPLQLTDSAIDCLWQHYGDHLRAHEGVLYTVIQRLDVARVGRPITITGDYIQAIIASA